MKTIKELNSQDIEAISTAILVRMQEVTPTLKTIFKDNPMFFGLVFTTIKHTISCMQYREVLGTGHLFPADTP